MDEVRFPNLYLAGAPKCGTTSLAYWLGQHPDIFTPISKEPLVFATDLTSALSRDPAARVGEFFGSWGAERFALDATTHYFFSKTAPNEIAAACKEPRVYMLVRNPADAVHSMYHQLRFNRVEALSTLEASLDAETDRAASLKPTRFGYPENLLYSRIYAYSQNIARFEDAIGRSRIKIILFEDLVEEPEVVVESIFKDLEIDGRFASQIEYSSKNSAKRSRLGWLHELTASPPAWAGAIANPFISRDVRFRLRERLRSLNTAPSANPPLLPDTRRRLIEQFRPEVEWLSGYLGRDLSHWCEM